MIAIPLMPSKLCKWLPLVLAVTIAVEGWLMLGPVTQLTLIAAAILRRVRGTLRTALGRPNEADMLYGIVRDSK